MKHLTQQLFYWLSSFFSFLSGGLLKFEVSNFNNQNVTHLKLFHIRSRFKKCVTFLFTFIFIFSSFSLNVSAAEEINSDLGFYVSDMEVIALHQIEGSTAFEPTTYTYQDANYGSPPIAMRKFTINSTSRCKSIVATNFINLNAKHEYNLDFYYAFDYINTSMLIVDVAYYSTTGEELKRQRLDVLQKFVDGNNHYTSDFSPDVSDITSSYNIRLELTFITPNSSTCSFRISNVINLTDKDDDSSWFQKIINKIEETISNIKLIPEKINNKLLELKDGIGGFFSDMWSKLQSAFSDIGNWFQELGNKIGGFFAELSEDITESLKSLFIPSEDFFDSRLDTFEDLYVSHFGIFAQIQVFFEDTLSYFEDLLSDDYVFIFPEISFPINGEKYTLIDEQSVDMSLWVSGDSWSSRLYKIYRLCASAILVFAVLQYASKVEHTVLGVNNYDVFVERMIS